AAVLAPPPPRRQADGAAGELPRDVLRLPYARRWRSHAPGTRGVRALPRPGGGAAGRAADGELRRLPPAGFAAADARARDPRGPALRSRSPPHGSQEPADQVRRVPPGQRAVGELRRSPAAARAELRRLPRRQRPRAGLDADAELRDLPPRAR